MPTTTITTTTEGEVKGRKEEKERVLVLLQTIRFYVSLIGLKFNHSKAHLIG
jgi:hypothetical protein